MTARAFLVSMPKLCRAKNAERWAKIIQMQYDEELANPHSVFARNSDDDANPFNRAETAFGFTGDVGRKEHCKVLAEILMLNHYKHEHGETKYNARIEELAELGRVTEAEYPEIMEAMSVDRAVTLGGWNA